MDGLSERQGWRAGTIGVEGLPHLRRIWEVMMEDWTLPACPACRGKGEVVMVGRSWISVRCVDCRGSGVVRPPLPPVAAAVVTSGDSVLLVRRVAAEGDMVWQLPAGEIKGGETPAEAAIRAAAKETGLKVAVIRRLGERVHPTTGRDLVYFACEIIDGEAFARSPREITEVRWCRLEELTEFVPDGFYAPVQWHLETILG